MRRSTEEEMRELVRRVLSQESVVERATEEDAPPTEEGWVAIRSRPMRAGYRPVESLRRKDGEIFERRPPRRKARRRPGPEVIRVVETGVYEIDLESLLKRNPIIIQKDGTYLIYLPSLFSGG